MSGSFSKGSAAVYYGPGKIELEQRDFNPLNNEALGQLVLKVRSCCVCGYDARVFRDGHKKVSPPIVLGHEICAEAVNDMGSIKSGTRVAVYPIIPCLSCFQCKTGRFNQCSSVREIGSSIDGGFSDYIHLPKETVKIGGLVEIPDNMSDVEASLIEPLACCVNSITNARGLLSGRKIESVAVIGDGPMGMIHAQLAHRLLGAATVTVAGKISTRIKFAKTLGFSAFSVIENCVSDILEPSGNEGYDLIFVAASEPSAIELSTRLAARRSCVSIFAGINSSTFAIDPHLIHYNEVTFTGTFSSTPQHFRTAVGLASKKVVDLTKLVTHTFPLARISEAFGTTSDYKGMRVAVKP